MAGYPIHCRKTLLDDKMNRHYARLAGPVMKLFGVELITAGTMAETLDGDPQLPPVTLIRFPTIERLRAWYDSPECAPLKQLRLEASIGNMIAFEGS